MDTISAIEKWYVARCNGDWEHQNGVTIETLDNPGWRIKIELQDTRATGMTLERVTIRRSQEDWIDYRVQDDEFGAA